MMQRFLFDRALLEYLANALWQVPLLAGGAWFLLRIVQPGPRVQHRLWLGVLLLALLLPLHGVSTAGTLRVHPQHAASSAQSHMIHMHMVQRGAPGMRHIATVVEQPQRHWAPFQPRVHRLRFSATIANGIAMLYVAFLAFKMLRIVFAWRAARRLVQHSRQSVLSAQYSSNLEKYCRSLRIKPPQIRESCRISGPVVVGAMTPVLLLPQNFAAYSQEEIEAAFLHELAHIQRRDCLVNLICEMAALPVAWHPATYALHRRIRRTREMVCDAIAAQQMQSQVGYAKCLLALARGMLADCRQVPHAQVLGLFSDNTLEERVMQLMERKTAIGSRTKAARLAGGAGIMLAAIGMAAVFHVVPTMAQSQTTPSSAAAEDTPVASPTPAALPAASESPAVMAQEDHAQPAQERKSHIRRRNAVDTKPFVIVDGERDALTPEQQQRIDKELADAQRQLAEATAKLNSPEIQKQISDAQRQALEMTTKLNSPEFKQQMADAQRQAAEAAAKFNSAEFKQQIADAQRQAMKAKTLLDSPEFQEQMKHAERQLQEATAKLNSPEFQKQMADAQRQAAEAMARLKVQLQNTPCKPVMK